MVVADASLGTRRSSPAGEVHDGYTTRILDAAQHQLELFGLRRTTVEDVAQRAGVARVTVYRRFPGRDQLLAAVVVREARRLFAELDDAAAAPGSLAERITEGFVTALRFTREHVLLQRLLDTEPELLLPLLTRGAEPLLAMARGYLAEQVRAEQRAGGLAAVADPDEAAELVVRLVQSLVLTPGGLLGATDDEAARRLATRYLVPALDLTSTGRTP